MKCDLVDYMEDRLVEMVLIQLKRCRDHMHSSSYVAVRVFFFIIIILFWLI